MMQLLAIHHPIIDKNAIVARYTYDAVTYEHTFTLAVTIVPNDVVVKRLAQWIAIIHATYLFSIEYMTAIHTDFPLTSEEKAFFEKVFYNGMAEFRYVNSIPITTKTSVTSTDTIESLLMSNSTPRQLEGRLLLNGGGKDGLVSAILLETHNLSFDLFQVGTSVAQDDAVARLNKNAVTFHRQMDERRKEAKYNGHRPTSAAIAIAGIFTAYLLGRKDVIASNEASANEETLLLDGVSVNHQYSKSYEFEQDLNQLLAEHSIDVRYFSLLRPLHELQIVKILSLHPESSSAFISCNYGFRKGFWCKKCAKCAFICLAFTAVDPKIAEAIFKQENPIASPLFYHHIEELIDPTLIKPLECVGTLKECQIAAKMILDSNHQLPKELIDLFVRNTSHVSPLDTQQIFTAMNDLHSIPDEKGYNSVLASMTDSLHTGDHLS